MRFASVKLGYSAEQDKSLVLVIQFVVTEFGFYSNSSQTKHHQKWSSLHMLRYGLSPIASNDSSSRKNDEHAFTPFLLLPLSRPFFHDTGANIWSRKLKRQRPRCWNSSSSGIHRFVAEQTLLHCCSSQSSSPFHDRTNCCHFPRLRLMNGIYNHNRRPRTKVCQRGVKECSGVWGVIGLCPCVYLIDKGIQIIPLSLIELLWRWRKPLV